MAILRSHMKDHGYQAPFIAGMSDAEIVERHEDEHKGDPRPLRHPAFIGPAKPEFIVNLTQHGKVVHSHTCANWDEVLGWLYEYNKYNALAEGDADIQIKAFG
jgi:hypothetical protein